MQLYEIIEQKDMLDVKLKEVKRLLLSDSTDKSAEEYLNLLDTKQRKLITIINANSKSTINISDEPVPISVAVVVRDILMEKMGIITDLIESARDDLDIINLQKQRDKFNSDFTLLSMAIVNNDIGISIG